MNSPRDYYTNYRLDVLAHVPHDVRHVLSVGCGEGRTESQLVGRGVNVTGIELNPEAAKIASRLGIHVICGDAHTCEIAADGAFFDCIIYADILEHLADPESVLRAHLQHLAPNGIVIVSVPNFRNQAVFWQLFVNGHVRYADAGILDRTNLRITTRRMIQEWFSNAAVFTMKVDYRIWRLRDRLISRCTFGLFREFLASQVIVIGRRSA